MYIPCKGDIVKINFDPISGHEQGGLRPAVVLSDISYNQMSGLCLLVPVTSKIKKFAFQVDLGGAHTIIGVALCDHLRTMDWNSRKIQFIEKLNSDILDDVLAKSRSLLE